MDMKNKVNSSGNKEFEDMKLFLYSAVSPVQLCQASLA
jgi:hypothetical protein